MPTIIDNSIHIMSRAGIGTAMFSMGQYSLPGLPLLLLINYIPITYLYTYIHARPGIFMALQDKLIACGSTLTAFSMVLKFVAGPAAMAIGAIAVGLHGDVLRVAIIQVSF